MSWSSGKDSAYALHLARSQLDFQDLEIIGLLTTVNASADRVAMHGVRRELLQRQAASLGLPVQVIELPHPCPNGVYEQRMGAAVEQARERGVEVMIFGDLFLEDIRAYREQQLAGTGLEPVFPLWGADTRALARQMLSAGVVATLTCVDLAKLPIELVGRRWDASLLAELPEGVDPCGERGEFHTFVSDGPGFTAPIQHRAGEVVERDGFGFADLLPS
ncbi:hypothetical protein DB30_08103 [Enhygromyxa salina]|uniref:Diphthamide synthase domain-containing protein n=1 Tax=Enhygromyxa salina TaxID=215803 RepID=A0A0C2CZX6_9BACT|nr:adenine nucleotide alpha hydrolase [Enhygromyxa salina]KIG13427.1 hypothetical protein DB30_08103 [Enhygromyxa salina]